MGGAWQPDPWGRFGFRWATELGWTEHVSNGTTIGIDPPGPRAPAPAPAPAPVVGRADPVAPTRPAVQRAAAPAVPDDRRARRWGLTAVAVLLAFVLGAVVFGRGGDGESAELVTASGSSAPEVASAGPVPPTLPATPATASPATALPTTTVETTVPPTTTETVPATMPPVGTGIASRNDLQIDDLEWLAIADLLVQEFTMEVPPRELVTSIGLRSCEAARASASQSEWEVALAPIIVDSGLPFGQFGMLLGASGLMMCVDDFVRLVPDEMPTF